MRELRIRLGAVVLSLAIAGAIAACNRSGAGAPAQVPADIRAVLDKPLYKNARWGLRVVDLESGKVVIDREPEEKFYIGSVRKLFTVGELLNEVGPTRTYDTPIFRRGTIDRDGVLHGDLILVAAGDLTMGGRTNPDGSIAISNYDHNEADSLGNAVLTAPDPLAGYRKLAQQVAAAGINRVAGDVIIDDRLFKPFNFRGEFDVTPIFVNDDVVDLTINPGAVGKPASVEWRPMSAALGVKASLVTSAPKSQYSLKLDPEFPACIGRPGCEAAIAGGLPADFVPPLTDRFPLVQTIRIVAPSNYARTVFIEALRNAGVKVDAATVAANPVNLLPPAGSYPADARIALLKGTPYSEDAKFILKVSYNIGADTSLMLLGLARGVDNMGAALEVERKSLAANYGIASSAYSFDDGSGGGETTATCAAVTRMLADMAQQPVFATYRDALPILGIDGSLAFVKEFESDPSLAGAAGQVRAKTGTYAQGSSSGIMLKGQAFAGYIDARSGRRLVYEVVVNDVAVSGLRDLLEVFQDEGSVSALLWRDN